MPMDNKNIYQVLLQARGMIGAVTKNAQNPFFKSNYADINNVIETITPVCESLGIVFTQCPRVTNANSDVLHTKITLQDNPDQFIESEIRLLLPSADMQKLGSAITYARRYALISMFGLETEDDDGNSATKHLTPTQKRNLDINKAMDKLVEAHKTKDLETATNIYEWAVDKDYVQVIDKHISLFGE
tara:strand:- start:223 stop:783 length:561 start_codon:yes stop_codon:yes gene_type:complete